VGVIFPEYGRVARKVRRLLLQRCLYQFDSGPGLSGFLGWLEAVCNTALKS